MLEAPEPGSGDGWMYCRAGHRHWGRFGAAGVLLRSSQGVLLQHRAPWTHEGDTWGVPGGARDAGEDVVAAALREAHEEGGIDPRDVLPLGWVVADHGDWSYTTVVAVVAPDRAVPRPQARNAESVEIRWWTHSAAQRLPLHPGLRTAWPQLARPPLPLTLVVDAANVVGSRPDGWWRDRVGAAARLRQRLVALTATGLPREDLPPGITAEGCTSLVPRTALVLEGAARAAASVSVDGAAAGSTEWAHRSVTAVAATGAGDDAVVRVAAERTGSGDQVVVVSADRELRRRVGAATGERAVCTGPTWLLNLLPAQ